MGSFDVSRVVAMWSHISQSRLVRFLNRRFSWYIRSKSHLFGDGAVLPSLFDVSEYDTFCHGFLVTVLGLAVLLLCCAFVRRCCGSDCEVVSRAALEFGCKRILLGAKFELAAFVLTTNLVASHHKHTKCCSHEKVDVPVGLFVLLILSFVLEVEGNEFPQANVSFTTIFAMEVLIVFFRGAVINGMHATPPRILACVSAFSLILVIF